MTTRFLGYLLAVSHINTISRYTIILIISVLPYGINYASDIYTDTLDTHIEVGSSLAVYDSDIANTLHPSEFKAILDFVYRYRSLVWVNTVSITGEETGKISCPTYQANIAQYYSSSLDLYRVYSKAYDYTLGAFMQIGKMNKVKGIFENGICNASQRYSHNLEYNRIAIGARHCSAIKDPHSQNSKGIILMSGYLARLDRAINQWIKMDKDMIFGSLGYISEVDFGGTVGLSLNSNLGMTFAIEDRQVLTHASVAADLSGGVYEYMQPRNLFTGLSAEIENKQDNQEKPSTHLELQAKLGIELPGYDHEFVSNIKAKRQFKSNCSKCKTEYTSDFIYNLNIKYPYTGFSAGFECGLRLNMRTLASSLIVGFVVKS